MIRLAEGIYTWSYFNPEKRYNFNGFIVTSSGQTTVIDPPTLSRDDEQYFDSLGLSPDLFVITNRNHTRALDWFLKRKEATVAMHEAEAGQVDIRVDRRLREGEVLAGGLEVIHLPGKSPGEIGLFWRERRTLILGDALIAPFGRLKLIPEAKLDDPKQLRISLQILRGLDFETLLLADGDPLLSGARAHVDGFLSSLS
jgi:glyoxylase-like metal-dependent hydrolase (beta-lactamase superfamily II)